MPADPYGPLGGFLTAYEAGRLATALEAGDSTGRALRELDPIRRDEAQRLLASADLGAHRSEITIAVLRAIAGARAVRADYSAVWTMPGPAPTIGRLTSEARRLVNDAQMSVVCSSFNFSKGSIMWDVLADASARPGVSVTIYLNDRTGSATTVAARLPRATVYRTATKPGRRSRYVSHAKAIVIDRATILVTSANFSRQAEDSNIELGLLVHDTALADSIEAALRGQHGVLYEQVPTPEPARSDAAARRPS
jgi:phosphatidylserine/phosphatidylglycerophosphate/cardiolipin synthase-like enzyme